MTLNADGTLTFTPKDDFNGATAFTYQAGSGLHYQLFDATFTTVANIPTDGGLSGVATDFDVGALAQSLTGSTDTFGIRYTGTINIANGGIYTFFTTSDDGSALYIDGVQVVGNDFSQGPTERSGSTTLAAGTHSIEIRYFEGGGGETLAVHVSGPDTADVKAALLNSTLLMVASANVNITVDAVNDAPDLANLGGTVAANEQMPVLLDLDAAVSDAELDALNGGSGLYTGATLTLVRQGGAVVEDGYGFDTANALFAVSGGSLKSGAATFADLHDRRRRADDHVRQRRDSRDPGAGQRCACAHHLHQRQRCAAGECRARLFVQRRQLRERPGQRRGRKRYGHHHRQHRAVRRSGDRLR